MEKTSLVILDLNGIMGEKRPHDEEKGELSGFKSKAYQFVFRKGAIDFVENLQKKYHVAVFSSTTYTNSKLIVEGTFLKEKPLFAWYRDRTHLDPNEKNGYKTVKLLEDVFTHPFVNEERKFSCKNTILVDDSQVKNRFNKPENMLIVDFSDRPLEEDVYGTLLIQIDEKMSALDL